MSTLQESNRPNDELVGPSEPSTSAESPHENSPPKDTPSCTDASPSSRLSSIDEEAAALMEGSITQGNGSASVGKVMPSESVEPGTELTGTVAGVSDDDVFLEFGVKSQGVMPRSQFGKKEHVEVGRRVDVVVDRYDAESGLLIVYRKGAIHRATWASLSVGQLVEGRVTGLIKGGLELDLQGIRAFMPGSQVDPAPLKDISVFLNEKVRCEVVEVDRRGKNVVLSRRKFVEHEQAENREKLKAELAVGQTRPGVVKNIVDFGAFVDLGGLEGLLHIRDISWGNVDQVADVLSPGQEVEVKVLKIDAERGRISLGLKQTQPDPWSVVPDRYPEETALKVRVVRVADFGAFAELEPGVEGLIPISEMGWSRVGRTSEVVSVGDLVDVVVIRVELKKRRIALSMKRAQPDPWAGVLDGFTEKSLAKGTVKRLADFGVFVELLPGVEGLIHISELSDQRVRTCGDVVQVGQEVEARVLGVDQENRRISLSLKQVHAPAPEAAVPAEPAKPRPKRKKPLRGGLSSHFDW